MIEIAKYLFNLKELRENKEVTQKQVSKAVRVNEKTIYNIEKNIVKGTSNQTLFKLMHYFGIYDIREFIIRQ